MRWNSRHRWKRQGGVMSSRQRECKVRQRTGSSWRWGTMVPSMGSRDKSRQELEGGVVAWWNDETWLPNSGYHLLGLTQGWWGSQKWWAMGNESSCEWEWWEKQSERGWQ